MGAGLDGWLVILIDGRNLFLLNKAFNLIIPLPPLPNYTHNFFGRAEYCKAVLSSPPSSSGECTVVLRLSAGHHLFYCRLPSDKSFKKLLLDIHQEQDIVFYKGRLYVLCYPNTIVIFDHLNKKVSRSWLVNYLADTPYPWRFFVSGNNELSIVAGSPREYSAFTLEGSEPRLVHPVNNVGEEDNQILLSNCYCSLSITTKEHKEFRRGTSYFEIDSRTFVLDTSKGPNLAKADGPRPLFFVMFSSHGIMK